MLDHTAAVAILAPVVGIGMFELATQMSMAVPIVVALIFGSAVVFIGLERFFNPKPGFLARGLFVNVFFCVSLMSALWFTTGHPAVFMWVIFVTSAVPTSAVICARVWLGAPVKAAAE